MAEFINRQEAIEQTKAEWAKLPLSETTGFGILMRVLTSIPAADVRPVVRGEWEWEMYQYTPHCSICGGAGFPGPANGKRYNFCPNCGSYNGGEDDV